MRNAAPLMNCWRTMLVPETRGAAGRAVRQVAMIGRAVVRGASLVPVIDVVFRRGRIVLPFSSLCVVVVVIVDHVLNDRDAMPMAFAHEVPVLVATAGARFDAEVMGVAIAPAERAAEFRERQQFDRIYAELAQVIDKPHCVTGMAIRMLMLCAWFRPVLRSASRGVDASGRGADKAAGRRRGGSRSSRSRASQCRRAGRRACGPEPSARRLVEAAGCRWPKKVQDVLVDRKVPRDERDRVPIVTDRERPHRLGSRARSR